MSKTLLIFSALEPTAAIKTVRLSHLTGSIERMFQRFFHEKQFWVVADVSDHNDYPAKGHHYFTLVEKDEAGHDILAKVKAAAWKDGSAQIQAFEQATGQPFGNNIRVLVLVTVSYSGRFGLLLTLHKIDAGFTLGRLEQQRQATISRLLTECADRVRQHEGRFITLNNSLRPPPVIQRVAVISSHTSKGYDDFREGLEKNSFGYRFRLTPFMGAVQGSANVEALCQKLALLCQAAADYDVVVIVRGGGNDTDFLLFDQFELCKQVAAFPIPVIAGLGHLKNQSLLDLMAHTPVKTPTAAAEWIIAHNRRFEEGMIDLRNRMLLKTQHLLASSRQQLVRHNTTIVNKTKDLIGRHKALQAHCHQVVVQKTATVLHHRKAALIAAIQPVVHRPKAVLTARHLELANLSACIRNHPFRFTKNQRAVLLHFETLCRMMSPVSLLRKGFALVYHNNNIITNGEDIPVGGELKIRLLDSTITATTTNKTQTDGNEFDL